MRWVAAILVACVCTHAAGREEDGLSAVELDALFSLKALLTYDPSGQVWQTWHGKPCHKDPWVGVECEASLTGKHVVGLDFPALGLKSSNLPEELGNLTKLRMLRLGRDWGNAFQGGHLQKSRLSKGTGAEKLGVRDERRTLTRYTSSELGAADRPAVPAVWWKRLGRYVRRHLCRSPFV